MSERSRGFRIGAIGLFVCAMGLLTYVWMSGGEGPAAVPVERTAEATPPTETPPQPTVVNPQATGEAQPTTEAPAEPQKNEAFTPERTKKSRSFVK